jgi:hypothetical protein
MFESLMKQIVLRGIIQNVLGWHVSFERFFSFSKATLFFKKDMQHQSTIYIHVCFFPSLSVICISFVVSFPFISLLYIRFCSLKVKKTLIFTLTFSVLIA